MKKLTNEDRIEIIRRLAVMDRNMVIGVAEVAVLHNTTIANVHQACSPARIARGWLNLHLPQRVQNNGRRRLDSR